jgi:hypothetical protein
MYRNHILGIDTGWPGSLLTPSPLMPQKTIVALLANISAWNSVDVFKWYP